jgi:hypothetical protein
MKTEKQQFEEKENYFKSKKSLIEQRIMLLQKQIDDGNLDDLQKNTIGLEILQLQSTLEGVENYWNHYADRVKSITENEIALTKECEEHYLKLRDTLISMSVEVIKKQSVQVQEQYNKIIPFFEVQLGQTEKNALYSLMKELYMRINKLK